MSLITSIMICGNEITGNLSAVNDWLTENNHKMINYIDCCDDTMIGGERCFHSDIMIGSFNNLIVSDFVMFLSTLDWGCHVVNIYIQYEDDEFFRLIAISNRHGVIEPPTKNAEGAGLNEFSHC